MEPEVRTCLICDVEFTATRTDHRCCTLPCSQANVYRKRYLREHGHPPRKVFPFVTRGGKACRLCDRPKPQRFVAGCCPMCGDLFVGTWAAGGQDRFCSRTCSKRADRAAHRDRKRAAPKGEPIFRRKVFVRDDWTCRLCGKAVASDEVVPHPLAPTLDHIVPLALGGEHRYFNVQTAHFICNSRKSANVTQLSFAA